MQSGEGAPTISLQLVPKMLAPLVSLWIPNAFVVSFKLETDESLLIVKARTSLNKYKHNVSFGSFIIYIVRRNIPFQFVHLFFLSISVGNCEHAANKKEPCYIRITINII